MTDPYAGLTAEFTDHLHELIGNCLMAGVTMHPYFGLRHPRVQAKLWRQSRSAAEIAEGRAKLAAGNAPFLLKCLDDAGPSRGPWATNALPGESWHQYGEAMDCVWIRNGVEEWSADIDGDANGYRVYASEAAKLGMTTLGSIGDWGHVQIPAASSPLKQYTLEQIDGIMKAKFAGL